MDLCAFLSVIVPFPPSRYIQPFRYRGFAFANALIQRNVAGRIVKGTALVVLFPEMLPNSFPGTQQCFFIGLLHLFETDKRYFMEIILFDPAAQEWNDRVLDRLGKA